MNFDFDRIVERLGTDSLKWRGCAARNLLPMWVADMDFASPPPIIDALQQRVAHGVFGYGMDSKPLKQTLVERMARLYGWAIQPDDIVMLPGLVSGLNIVSRAVKQALGLDQAGFDAYLHERLFDPIGMSRATPHYDGAGTFVGSSYVYATARDFARYGYLHLRDGMWDGRRILPEGWVDVARTARSGPDEDGQYYGAFWWVWGDEHGTFAGQGYEGQLVAVVPALDLVLVRLGKSPIAHRPALFQFYRDVISAFADGAAGEGDPR